VDLPENTEELIECIIHALAQPEMKSNERTKLLDQKITYRDGKATHRIAAQLKNLILDLS